MDGEHPSKNKRPKRRKAQDNPYSLIREVDGCGDEHFYITFEDGQGRLNRVEVSRDLFFEFDRFELEDLSYLNTLDRHYEHSELTETALWTRAAVQQVTVEETVIQHLQSDQVRGAIEQLPQIQRRRLVLYYFRGLNYRQIAEMEGCQYQAVQKSIHDAIRKIKKFLN